MVDFFQLVIKDFDLGSFIDEVKPDEWFNKETAEVKIPIIYKDGPLDFIAHTHKIKIKGSLHKYWNYINGNESQNYNDFDLIAIAATIDRLTRKYNLNWEKGYFENLEFGLNISISRDPKEVISFNVLHLKGKTHSRLQDFRNSGILKVFYRSNLGLKTYSKKDQYSLKDNILRIEIQLRTKRIIERLGVVRIKDLTSLESINSLYNKLQDLLNDLCILDKIEPPKNFTENEKDLFNTFSIGVRYLNQDITSRSGVLKRKLRFDNLIQVSGLDTIKNEIVGNTAAKYQQLIKSFKEPTIKREPKVIQLTDSTKYISGICTPSICNRVSSKYGKILPENRRPSDMTLVKKPRNDESNPRNNYKKLALKTLCTTQLTLFPIHLVIPREKYDLIKVWEGTKHNFLANFTNYSIAINYQNRQIINNDK